MGWLPIVNYTGAKGGGWLIMVDISYTTLHKRTGKGEWLATPSTPLDQPLLLKEALLTIVRHPLICLSITSTSV